jgi:hypothetical protein
MALGSTQSLTEMSTRNLPGGKVWPVLKADNLTAICEPLSRKCGSPDVSQPYGLITGIALPFTLYKDGFNFWFIISCISRELEFLQKRFSPLKFIKEELFFLCSRFFFISFILFITLSISFLSPLKHRIQLHLYSSDFLLWKQIIVNTKKA